MMGRGKHYQHVLLASRECTRCGACLAVCPLLADHGLHPGEVALAIAEDRVAHETIMAVQRCDLCGLCGVYCKSGIVPSEVMLGARTALHERERLPVADYEVALIDRDWNIFSLYRDTYGIDYADLKRDEYETLFLPGCSLAAFAPELTRAAHGWLLSQGIRAGFSELCCGEPLRNMGLQDRAERYADYLSKMLHKAGADSIVAACPGSVTYLTQSLSGTRVVSLYRLMREAGVRIAVKDRLTVHDSCPDRRPYGPRIGKDIREMLAGNDFVEMEHHGKESICCGSGGLVSLVDQHLFLGRARRRVAEAEAVEAARVVTACMTCVYTLSQVSAPRRVSHFLELLFGIPVNQDEILDNLYAMWNGEQGDANQDRLLGARCFTSWRG